MSGSPEATIGAGRADTGEEPEDRGLMHSKTNARARGRAGDDRLIRQSRTGDRRAREEMIERYLPLAARLALRYRRGTDPADDLVQVAAVGLVKAVDRWNPARGVPFPAFAAPTIQGELRRHFRDMTWGVRPPRRLQELSAAVECTRDAMQRATGREPTVALIAGRMGRTRREVEEGLLAGAARTLHSLDAPARDGHETVGTVGDVIGSDEAGYERADSRATIERLSRALDARERIVLGLRFEHELTQRDIGQHVGCSQGQVSRIISSALAKLAAHAQPLTPAAA
jgi:RNA polymerase sigma-B factor